MKEAADRRPTVILDTNFLFIPRQFGVDIFDELQRLLGGPVRCIVPSTVLEELRLLRQDAKPSDRGRVAFALSLAERCERLEVDAGEGESVDDGIIRLAKRLRCPVATNDADLKRKLRAEMIPIIYLRKKAYLEMEGAV